MARLGLIGGSGLDSWAHSGEPLDSKTAYGRASGPAMLVDAGKHQVVFIPRHGGDHSLAPHRINYRANIQLLREQSVTGILAINTVGSINRQCVPGSLCVPNQLIDYSWGREHSFVDDHTQGVMHVEFGQPFDARLREVLLDTVRQCDLTVMDGGCIGVTQGPRLETAAEVRRLKQDGCDLVGMTSMPEAGLAREAGLPYACLAVSANWAAGIEAKPISMEAIGRVLAVAMDNARLVIETLLENKL